LNDEGRRQAAALAARLAPLPIDAIYASPLERTIETAQAIAGPRGLPLRIVEGLGEVKYGEWQGAELKELYKCASSRRSMDCGRGIPKGCSPSCRTAI
jgi:probable phosphoglycerate mutase